MNCGLILNALLSFSALVFSIAGVATPIYKQSIGGMNQYTYLSDRTCFDDSGQPTVCAQKSLDCPAQAAILHTAFGFAIIGIVFISLAAPIAFFRAVKNPASSRTLDGIAVLCSFVAWASFMVSFPTTISLYTVSQCEDIAAVHELIGTSLGPSGILQWIAWMCCMVAVGREVERWRASSDADGDDNARGGRLFGDHGDEYAGANNALSRGNTDSATGRRTAHDTSAATASPASVGAANRSTGGYGSA